MTEELNGAGPKKPRVSIKAVARQRHHEPIKDALLAHGLLREEDIVPPNTNTTQETGLTEPPIDITPPVGRRSERPGQGVTLPRGSVPPIDPDRIVGPDGFSPYMRRLMATPGFDSLLDIFKHQRPRGSKRETQMIVKHIYPLASEIAGLTMTEDRQGNIVCDLGENPAGVLWSCHTDTVHSDYEVGMQDIAITTNGHLRLMRHHHSCLGADDGTGVWLMIEMIRAGVPGRYVFHFGEERGCIGSRFIVDKEPWVLEGIRYAIAFDRQDTGDIVNSQGGRRCCSDTFVNSLIPLLPAGYAGARGVWTDTGVYMDVVPECTNLSVGYSGQHSSHESQDLPHLYRLRDAMVKFDQSKLTGDRDPVKQKADEDAYWAQRRLEEEERARQRKMWSATFPRTATGGTSTTTSGATFGEVIPPTPKFLKKMSSQDQERVIKMAMRAEWIELTAAELATMTELLKKQAVMKYGFLRNYLRKCQLLDEQRLKFSDDHERDEDDTLDIDRHFGNQIPPKPRSMLELIKAYPNEFADVLEQEGYEVEEFWNSILRSIMGA